MGSDRLNTVSTVARVLMNKHGLGDWVFEWDRAKRRAGCCYFQLKKITLSEYYAINEANPEADIVDTILHEIAHAVSFIRYGETGHGKVWKKVCIGIGAKPERCYDSGQVAMPKGKYKATCPGCEKEYRKHRMRINQGSRFHYCPKCGPISGKLYFTR